MAQGGSGYASASSYSNDGDVNENFLTSLMEMGIDRDSARQALRIVNNRSLEDALAVVFGESPAFSIGPSPVSISGASVEQATQVSYESSVIRADSNIADENIMAYKMLFVVNASLRMSSGKMAAQVAHCAVDLYQDIIDRRLRGLNYWKIYGQTKIVVRADSAEELLEIHSRAEANRSIATSLIQDAGRTEVASGSVTCLGLFGTNEQLDPLTRHLKLMNDCLKCSGSPAVNPNTSQKSRKTKKEAEPTPTTTDSNEPSNS